MIPTTDLPRALIHLLLVRPFTAWVIGFNVAGEEHVKGLGPMILASNHNSHLDTLLILSSLSLPQALRVHPVAAEDYFGGGGVMGPLARWLFNLITVRRDRVSRKENPLERMAEVLRRGESLLIFPEGTRGEPDRLAAFKTGVGHLAAQHPDVPVIPVFVHGSGRAMPRGAAVPVPLWTSVAFSSPVEARGRAADITLELERSVRRMAEEAVRSDACLAAPPRREEAPKPPLRVAVAGIDGSGKSTCYRSLVALLAADRVVTGVGDELLLGRGGSIEEADWVPGAFLKQCLHRLAKGATRLTGYKAAKLAELIARCGVQDAMTLKFRPAVAASDGHPLVNTLAWGILAYPDLFSADLCRETLDFLIGRGETKAGRLRFFARRMPEVLLLGWLADLRPPDMLVLLAVPPERAVERIERRGEKRQLHETAQMLGRLQEAYGTVARLLGSEYGVEVRHIEAGERAAADILEEAHRLVRARLEAHER